MVTQPLVRAQEMPLIHQTQGRIKMNSNIKTARIAGALFLIAIVASILGGVLIESNLVAADGIVRVSADRTQVTLGVLLELLNAIAVIGIAALLFPILSKHNQALAVGYVGNRTVEAIVQIVGSIIPLALVTMSQKFLTPGTVEASSFQASGALALAARAQLVGTMLGIFFSLGALLFYCVVYQSRLLPRFIPVWGLIGVVSVLTWNVLEMFGIPAGMYLAIPILLNEIFLGIWLIVKGFNPSAVASESARQN
jgi:hypothetical protein